MTRHHASVVPGARWKQMIGRRLPANAESALLSDSPILAAVLAGPAIPITKRPPCEVDQCLQELKAGKLAARAVLVPAG